MKRQWIDRDFIGGCDRPRASLRFSSGKIQRPVSSPTQSLWLRRTCALFCEICHGHRPCRGRARLARILR